MERIIVDSCVFINAMKEDSIHRDECLRFLNHMSSNNQPITLPAHGWFEVWCNMKRIEKIDGKFKGTSINSQWTFPMELIHIDEKFIHKYGNVELPYTKAADHIYLVVAYVNNYPLVTTDNGMGKVARQLQVEVYTPSEYIAAKSVA